MTIASSHAAIESWNPRLNALRETERTIAPRRHGDLRDLALSVKDVIDVKGWTITCNHRPFARRRPWRDAAVIARLRREGACLIGVSGTLEFAYGGFTSETLYPHARNPWNLERSPGGSSAGAGAAVAAGLCDAAIATDTSGSVRGPAALCGVLGLKPTHGSIANTGIYPLADTLNVAGVLARDPAILARVASVMLQRKLDAAPAAPRRIGWLRSFDTEAGTAPEVAEAVRAALMDLEGMGAAVSEAAPASSPRLYHAACIIVLLYEAWRVHGRRLRSARLGYDKRTWARLALGAFISQSSYRKALALRAALRAEIDTLFTRFDVLVTATAPSPAGDPSAAAPFGMLSHMFLTTPFSLTGHPALAMPIGFDRGGLPLSMQLVAPFRGEGVLLAAAAAHRTLRPWQLMMPSLKEESTRVL